MRTAYCLTPDNRFFPPAVRAVASILDAEPDFPHDIVIACEPDDVTPGFDRLPRSLRERITLKTLDFSALDRELKPKGRFSRAVFRRLFLDEILPPEFDRIVRFRSTRICWRRGPGCRASPVSRSAGGRLLRLTT